MFLAFPACGPPTTTFFGISVRYASPGMALIKGKHSMMHALLVRPLRGALAVLVCIASLTLPLRTEALLLDAAAQLKIAPDLLATVLATTTPIVPVMVPVSHLADLAHRTDVASISPTRAVTRTASLLQISTGAANASVPNRRTLDGSGVGIAVVASGIAYSHQSVSGSSLLGLQTPTRVRQAIDFVQLGKGLDG